jgi:hypothetical protein
MNWYLKKADGEEYGPIDTPTLQHWAADGRVTPEDLVSEDREDWGPAPDIEDLEMHWTARLNNGTRYGPVHLMAVHFMIQEKAMGLDSPVTDVRTGEEHPAGSVLVNALTLQNRQLSEDLESLTASKEADHSELESFRKLFGDGIEAAAQTINELEALKSAKAGSTAPEGPSNAGATATDEAVTAGLKKRIHVLEKQIADLESKTPQPPSAGEEHPADILLQESFKELSKNYDLLMGHLEEKRDEIKTLLEIRKEYEKSASEQIARLESTLRKEREEHEALRRQLNEIQEAHLEFVRSYREMNDKLIRLRQSGTTRRSPVPARRLVDPSSQGEESAGSGSSPEPDEGDWKPRVRLTK